MQPKTLLISLVAGTAAAPSILRKRCSPIRDEAYQNGYLPPVPCWLTFDPACQPFIPQGTEIEVDHDTSSATVRGISEFCVATIAEEHAREQDGRRTYGWTEKIGNLNTTEEGVLRITGMSCATVEAYQDLRHEEVKTIDSI